MTDDGPHLDAIDEDANVLVAFLALQDDGHVPDAACDEPGALRPYHRGVGGILLARGPFELSAHEAQFPAVPVTHAGRRAGAVERAQQGRVRGLDRRWRHPQGQRRPLLGVHADVLGGDARCDDFGAGRAEVFRNSGRGGCPGLEHASVEGLVVGGAKIDSGCIDRPPAGCGLGFMQPARQLSGQGPLRRGRRGDERHRVGDAAVLPVFRHVVEEREKAVVVLG